MYIDKIHKYEKSSFNFYHLTEILKNDKSKLGVYQFVSKAYYSEVIMPVA